MQGCVISLVAVFAVIAFVIAIQASSRASKAVADLAELRRRLDRLAAKEAASTAEQHPEPVIVTPPEPKSAMVTEPLP